MWLARGTQQLPRKFVLRALPIPATLASNAERSHGNAGVVTTVALWRHTRPAGDRANRWNEVVHELTEPQQHYLASTADACRRVQNGWNVCWGCTPHRHRCACRVQGSVIGVAYGTKSGSALPPERQLGRSSSHDSRTKDVGRNET